MSAALFSLVYIKGEEMEPGHGLAVFVEEGGAETNMRMGSDPRSCQFDRFLG
jgi:hypothetical protein